MNLLQELEWLRNNRSVNFFTASEVTRCVSLLPTLNMASEAIDRINEFIPAQMAGVWEFILYRGGS